MPVVDFLEFLNPLKYFSHEGYQSFWRTLFAAAFLFLAFWFGVRRQRFQIGFAYFMISVAITYGATVMRFLGFR